MDKAVLHYYRQARAHQVKTYGSKTIYPSGRTEFTGGGAAYGCHAQAALQSARGTIFFRADLSRTVAEHQRRSRAAKRGWRTRRAAA
jgi:hypothetical protein